MKPSTTRTAINKVLIVGGTHGNEPTGIYLLNKWRNRPEEIRRPGLKTALLLANPEAQSQGRRYLDRDLNRCFLARELDQDLAGHENGLARQINRELGPKPDSIHDLIIDMHTTTADMGVTLICDDKPGTLRLAARVKAKLSPIRIYCFGKSDRIESCLRSIAPHGLGIEIGPIPQNVLRQDILDLMSLTVLKILDVVEELSRNRAQTPPPETEIFYHRTDVTYPDPDECPDAVIHGRMEGRNYKPLKPGAPIFTGSDGRVISYSGPADLYSVFVNEAAYYEKGIAFSLVEKTSLKALEAGI